VGARRPASPGTARRERERRRHEQEVLAAAERVFARAGVAGATMAGIAREAEFAVGTLYKFFPSKEALFERLLVEQVEALVDGLERATAEARGARAKLEAFALAEARFAAGSRAFLSLFASPVPGIFGSPGEVPRAVEAVRRLDALLLAIVRAGVRKRELGRAIPPGAIALAFGSATRAYLLENVIKAPGEVDEEAVRAFVGALLDGLASGPPRRTKMAQGEA
jgi:AcrR family transcriptional regulator